MGIQRVGKTYYDSRQHVCLENICQYWNDGLCSINDDDYTDCPIEEPRMEETEEEF